MKLCKLILRMKQILVLAIGTYWRNSRYTVLYTNFDIRAIIFIYISIGLGVLIFVMGMARKDKRYLSYLIAGTQVRAC